MMAARHAGRPELLPLLDALAGIAAAHPAHAAVWPYQETLARRLNRSTRTIQRWIAELEALGILARARRWMNRGDGRFTGRASRYWPRPIRDLIALARHHQAARLPRSHRPATGGGSLSPMARKTGPAPLAEAPPGGRSSPRPPPGRLDDGGAWHPAVCACPECIALELEAAEARP